MRPANGERIHIAPNDDPVVQMNGLKDTRHETETGKIEEEKIRQNIFHQSIFLSTSSLRT